MIYIAVYLCATGSIIIAVSVVSATIRYVADVVRSDAAAAEDESKK